MTLLLLAAGVDAEVAPETALNWILGGVAAFIIFAIAIRIIYHFQTKNQQRIVTGLAVPAGVVTSLGLSPFGTIAIDLAQLSQLVPAQFPEWVEALTTAETVFGLFYGVLVMWESGGPLATGSFIMALVGGVFLPYSPGLGFVLVLFAWLLMEASPADRW
jgi:hypothetical protein